MMNAWERISAVLLRHVYLLRGSYVRVFDILFWPTMQMILWGFITRYLSHQQTSAVYYATGMILGAVLLWEVLFRVQIGIALGYLEEIWARNLGHLFVSPLRPAEWWGSMMLFSFCRMTCGVLPALLLAIPFYGFSIFHLGLPLVLFLANLAIMGWWLGFLIAALLLKAGPGAEHVAWAATFLLAPLCCVYYPVSVLPAFLQPVALSLPAVHVFEGLRTLVEHQVFDAQEMWWAFGLNAIYMSVALLLLTMSFKGARIRGTLLQSGE